MTNIELIATAAFGLEAVVKREVEHLGYSEIKVSDGKVTFKGDKAAIPNCNLWLRSADRVLIKIGEFKVLTFDELFEKTKALPWEEWITEDGKFTVNGKSVKSKLFSISDCQAIVKKAVVEKLKQKYHTEWFPETGAEFTIQVALLEDIATLTIDTSGVGLHKRGYRINQLEAPLKETLAAAMIQLSYWRNDRLLLDPFCGSGTIPIEAALIGKNIAPGLNRNFASENWPCISKDLWKKARSEAYKAIDQESELKIKAYDINPHAIDIAKENAIEAGVDDCIQFEVKAIKDVYVDSQYGILIANPPYGERIGDMKEIGAIYKTLRQIFKSKGTWSLYIITSDENIENAFGRKADRKRKLFNGNIKVDYYQFYGERPPKKNEN